MIAKIQCDSLMMEGKPCLQLYLKAMELEEKAGDDPETEPHLSYNKARAVWKELVQKVVLTCKDEKKVLKEAVLAWVCMQLSRNYNRTEEKHDSLMSCYDAVRHIYAAVDMTVEIDTVDTFDHDLDLLNPKFMRPELCAVLLDCLNYIGFIHADRDQYLIAKTYLERAETLFKKWELVFSEEKPPLNLEAALILLENEGHTFDVEKLAEDKKKDCWKEFNHAFTLTLFYLAQVLKSRYDDIELAAYYCLQTLTRQYNWNNFEPDFKEWSLNAITASVYYMGAGDSVEEINKNLCVARHWIAAAEYVMEKLRDDDSDNDEVYQETRHQIYRCWTNFGLELLGKSDQFREELKKREQQDEAEIGACISSFEALNMDCSEYEDIITAKLFTDLTQAKRVFVKVQRWVELSKKYYTLESHADQAVFIAQNTSRAYKYLSRFEPDLSIKCKLHKKRQDILDAILEPLNPTYYLLLIRQLLFELGEIANEILDCKVQIAEEECKGNPNAHQITKINVVADRAADYFQRFLDTFECAGGKRKSKVEVGNVRTVLLAHFYIARVTSKKLTPDLNTKIEYSARSLAEYRYLVNYCETVDPDAQEFVRGEYEACKDMVQLMPLKIDRMKMLLTKH